MANILFIGAKRFLIIFVCYLPLNLVFSFYTFLHFKDTSTNTRKNQIAFNFKKSFIFHLICTNNSSFSSIIKIFFFSEKFIFSIIIIRVQQKNRVRFSDPIYFLKVSRKIRNTFKAGILRFVICEISFISYISIKWIL